MGHFLLSLDTYIRPKKLIIDGCPGSFYTSSRGHLTWTVDKERVEGHVRGNDVNAQTSLYIKACTELGEIEINDTEANQLLILNVNSEEIEGLEITGSSNFKSKSYVLQGKSEIHSWPDKQKKEEVTDTSTRPSVSPIKSKPKQRDWMETCYYYCCYTDDLDTNAPYYR